MSTRAICRMFGITLVTWSIIIQTVGGVPIAVPNPQYIHSTKNVTSKITPSKNNVTLNSESPGRNIAVNSSTQLANSALVTSLPTSEYVELTSIDNNTTKLFKNSSNVITAESAKVQDDRIFSVMSNQSKPIEKETTVNVHKNKTMSSFLNETITLSNETKNAKSDIVTVLDKVTNYDSLLSNFMNHKSTTNSTEQPSNELDAHSSTQETTTAELKNPNWKKYNTIVRKRTTKTIAEITSEIPTTIAETKYTTRTSNKNKTENVHQNDNKSASETLEVIASTWNRTTYSPTVTDATQTKRSDDNVTSPTTTEAGGVVDAGSEILASRRSGYLDNSKWVKEIYITTGSPESTTFAKNGNKNNDVMLNSTAMPPQQQIEDTLKVEHLRKSKVSGKQTTNATSTEDQNITNIKQNASINPLLYRVNSNYKPLKKLEVQPHKSFTIDPDDNSWRNESINSRGIVYKPKNSSKPFTQVLKNKTESEWHNLLEKEFKDEEIELKDRLEKIAAKRKSKKKLLEDINEALTSTELQQGENTKSTTPYLPVFNQVLFTTSSPIGESSSSPQTTDKSLYDSNAILTEKPMEHLNNADAYDSYDEDDRFVTLTEFDLIKTTMTTPRIKTPSYPQKAFITTAKTTTTHYPPNRKGTIEYFPPKKTKVNYNNYDFQFKDKVNTFTTDFMKNRLEPLSVLTTTPRVPHIVNSVMEPSLYIMPPYETKLSDVEDNGYVIKHYKDFISKSADEALSPLGEHGPHSGIVHKFVDSFNRNADKLKEEFPILYNTNIVHRGGDDGRIVASSSAYLRRLHGSPPSPLSPPSPPSPPSPTSLFDRTHKYDPTCANHTVELSPAYELHYFVNDEEQKQPPLLDPPLYGDFA